MPPQDGIGVRSFVARSRALIFPVLIVASVLVILAPMPPVLMDLLLAGNVTVGVIVLLTTIYVARPLEFSVFPALLLGTTLARLVLNIASTRLILTRGALDGTRAAGGVIEAFGQFVAGGNVVVGLILFAILIVIQFLVITKGATRISEVAARFALDGMPGKQMAIDADLNAGVITPAQARQRREEVGQQADFYGAMDGASKFVRGDAIASIVITLINILGGLYLGMVDHGLEFRRAVEVFTTLTIGDGLVTQVPAFLISLAAGMIVTRTSVDSDLPREVVGQLFRHAEALFLSAAFLLAMSFTGLPTVPMLALGGGCVLFGVLLKRTRRREAQAAQEQTALQAQTRPEPKPEDHLAVDPMELELGLDLLRLADPHAGGDLLDRVTRIRHLVAQELGIVLPKVRVRDNVRLERQAYQVKLRDVPVARGQAYSDGLLAIDTGATTGDLPGLATVEPAFGRPAKWIEPSVRDRAEMLGWHVVEPTAAIVTHLTEIVREHAAELLSRQQVHQLLANLKERAPKVVEEVVPDVLKAAQVHQVLGNLLRERVPVRDLETILEALGSYADRTKEPAILTEYVRHALARVLCQQYRDRDRVLHAVTLDPTLEDLLAAGFDFGERGLVVKLSPQIAEAVTRAVAKHVEPLVLAGHPPLVLCAPQIRAGLKQITTASLPKLAVLSLNEVTRDTDVEAVGQVSLPGLAETVAAARK
jgi:flagellar biosynthesis protein FlhA